MPEAIPELVWFAVLLFAFACVWTVRRFVHALFQPIINVAGHVPGLGGVLSSALGAIENAISNALGDAEHAIDRAIGASWHYFTRLMDWSWRELRAHSVVLQLGAWLIHQLKLELHALRGRADRLLHTIEHVPARFKQLERELHGIEHGVKELERELQHGIGHDVLPKIRSLDKELHRVEHKVIPGIEADVTTAETEITNLERWIRLNIPLPGTRTFAGAIAWALGYLGLGGLRCNSLLSSLRNRGCGLWSGLEDLLGLLFDAVVFVDLCHMLPIVEQLFAEFEAPLVDLIAAAADAACAHPPPGWVELEAPALSLPAVYYTGAAIGG